MMLQEEEHDAHDGSMWQLSIKGDYKTSKKRWIMILLGLKISHARCFLNDPGSNRFARHMYCWTLCGMLVSNRIWPYGYVPCEIPFQSS